MCPHLTTLELWRAVKKYEGFYLVSSHGRVISAKTGYDLKPTIAANGYSRITLQRDTVINHWTTHRIVASAWIVIPYKATQVNHLDSDKLHNCRWNLEWVTAKGNIHHAIDAGRFPYGEAHGRAKLTENDVREIRQSSESGKALAARFHVNPSTIGSIRHFRNWKHVN